MTRVLLVMTMLWLSACASTNSTPIQKNLSLDQLLDSAGIELRTPSGFNQTETAINEILSYEYALQHDLRKLEIRYAFRPIKMVEIEYEDPHNAAPDPNHLFAMLFETLTANFMRGGNSPTQEYSTIDANQKFNADWAAMSVLDVTPDFAADFDQMILLALHKNNAADVYLMLLFDNYDAVKEDIAKAMESVRFK